MDRPDGMPVIQSLEVMCGKDHMDVHLTFSHPFEGIVSSKGAYCVPFIVIRYNNMWNIWTFVLIVECGRRSDVYASVSKGGIGMLLVVFTCVFCFELVLYLYFGYFNIRCVEIFKISVGIIASTTNTENLFYSFILA